VLLVATYPSETRARLGLDGFLKGYLAGAAGGVGKGGDGKWAGCDRRGTRLAVVVSAPDSATVKELLAEALHGAK
jgi:hypothetical protein